MRRRHLQKLWREHSQVRSHDPTALNEWATVTTAWHVLARGGELERLTVGDLQFKRQRRSGRRYAILWIAPLKKRGGAQPKLPQFIYEQTSLEEWEPYRALRRLTEIREGAAASAPLFTARNGARLTTARFRALIKRYARMLGWNPKEAGAHSPRIGGATEYAATGKVSQLLLEAKRISELWYKYIWVYEIFLDDRMCPGRSRVRSCWDNGNWTNRLMFGHK